MAVKRLFALALCATAAAAAAQDGIVVTAAGLERFDGARIKLGYSDPRSDAGFEILAFNLDDEPEDWREASADRYDIPWLNVTDGLAFESPVANMFRINALPASFLLASDGATIARDLRGESLELRLGELLAEPMSGD